MKDHEHETMRDLFESYGCKPEELENPRFVSHQDIDEDTVVVAYTVVRNPDLDGPATTWEIREYPVQDVIETQNVKEETDGAVSYPEDTPVTHGVIWAHSARGPKVQSIGHGDEMYGPESDFPDPMRWERSPKSVLGSSDDFVRFRL